MTVPACPFLVFHRLASECEAERALPGADRRTSRSEFPRWHEDQPGGRSIRPFLVGAASVAGLAACAAERVRARAQVVLSSPATEQPVPPTALNRTKRIAAVDRVNAACSLSEFILRAPASCSRVSARTIPQLG